MANQSLSIDSQTLHDKIALRKKSRGGGRGRRARLKIWWVKARAGSSPAPGTFLASIEQSHESAGYKKRQVRFVRRESPK